MAVRADVLAGATVTAYLIPQVMAYSELAGLPAVHGIWAAIGALTAYAALGSSTILSVGPESTTALLTAAAIGSVTGAAEDPATFTAALAFVVAAVCGLAWLARLSVLAELFSRPVLVGYMAGIALIMVVSQLGKVTGLSIDADDTVGQVRELATRLPDVDVTTVVLSGTCLVVMLVGASVLPRAPMALLGMLGATAAVALLDLDVSTVGEIPAGLPTPGLPSIDWDAFATMVVPALGVAFVAYTDNVLTGRAFATRRSETVDPSRELLALGAANVGSGLLQGFPVSSSGSRTAIVDAMGGGSRLVAATTVGATIVALLTLRPVLAAFPQAALGAVVVFAATRLVDLPEFRRILHFRRTEFALALATTAAVLVVGVLYGVLVAIGLSIVDLLRRVARPHDAVQGFVPDLPGMHDIDDYADAETVPGLVIYRYDSPLFFANADDFRRRALAAVEAAAGSSTEPVTWFVLNVEAVSTIDITGVDALESLRAQLAARDITVGLVRLKQDLRHLLAPSGILERIGEDHLFPTLPAAVEAFRSR